MVTELAKLQVAIDAAVEYAGTGASCAEAVELVCDYYRIEHPGDRNVVARLAYRRIVVEAARGLSEARG